MDKVVHFYEPEDEFGFLSNFSPYTVEYDHYLWLTSEHAYQAQKFNDKEIRQAILIAKTPDEAFALSRKFATRIREDWLNIRRKVMKEVITEKFSQHIQLSHWLVATGGSVLVEHSKKDDFWGDGGDGSGRNELGHILMEIRDELALKSPFNQIVFFDRCRLPTQFGEFEVYAFKDLISSKEHLALVFGSVDSKYPALIRVHSECLTGDALFSMRCDCGYQLQLAMEKITANGSGVILYLRQEGRGIGLLNKLRAYRLQDHGADTVEANEILGFDADLRSYDVCKYMLDYLGIQHVQLM